MMFTDISGPDYNPSKAFFLMVYGRTQIMPIINVDVWKGFLSEAKNRVIVNITSLHRDEQHSSQSVNRSFNIFEGRYCIP